MKADITLDPDFRPCGMRCGSRDARGRAMPVGSAVSRQYIAGSVRPSGRAAARHDAGVSGVRTQ